MPLQLAILDAVRTRGSVGWGEVVDGFKCYPCHRAQLDVLASRAKYTAAFFGTGSGKTAMLPIWLYKHLNRHKLARKTELWRAMVVSPSQPSFESSQLKQHLLGVFGDTVFAGEWSDQKKVYAGPGFEIIVRTAENDYKRISGGQFDAIACDEAFQIANPEVWDEIRRRSNIRDAPVLIVTTPNADGWLFGGVMTPFLAGDPEFYVRQAHTRENPAKTAEQHERFLAAELVKLGRAKFDRMYGGQFAQLTGLVYELMGDEKSPAYPVMKLGDVLPSPAVRAFGSVDWGYFPDVFAAHVYVHCVDDRIYAVDEIYENKLQLDEIGRRLRAWIDRWSLAHDSKYAVHGGFFAHYFCDSSRPEAAAMVRRFGVPIGNRKVAEIDAGISVVDQMFRVGRLRITDRCPNLIRELRSYAFDAKGRPVGNAGDHAADSLRYGISSYMQNRPITLLPDEAVAAEPLETAIRLGQVTDAAEAEQFEAETEAKRIEEHRLRLMNWEPEDT